MIEDELGDSYWIATAQPVGTDPVAPGLGGRSVALILAGDLRDTIHSTG
jgi:hypothetical protein